MDGTYLTKDGTYDMIQDESKQKKSTDEGCIVTDLCVSSPKETLQKNLQGKRAGRWSPEEKLLFLHGLKQFGRGRWKKIQTFLPTRSLVQIKSHAQKVVKRLDNGEDIFTPMRDKASFIEMLLAKRTTQKCSGLKTSSPSPRPLPKLKLKPRRASVRESSQDYNLLFSVRNGCKENDSGSNPVFRTSFGAGNVSFSFRTAPSQSQELENEAFTTTPSLTSVLVTPSTSACLLTPDRPDPNVIKSTAVEAAAALCQLSSAWDKKSSGEQHYSIVSP